MDLEVSSMITTSNKDFRFFDKNDNTEYNPVSLNIDNGVITSIVLEDDTVVSRDDIFVVDHLLDLEGVGAIPPGSIVRIRDCEYFDRGVDYLLDFGWHINSSNQCIYSWYLIELKPSLNRVPHTLYKEIIPHLDLVRFDHYTFFE